MAFLSLCMIVKDEEDELPIVLGSAADLVDEVIVYDTGSTDRTVPVARQLGATVIEGYWDDDFSRARNAALEHCSGEWILWLDADESVHGDFDAMRRQLEHAPEDLIAYAVSLETLEGAGLSGHSAFFAHRLFRRERCKWFEPLHEQIGERETGASPEFEWMQPIRILHRGYINVAMEERSKLERNRRLAERSLETADTDAKRAYALFNLGRTLSATDEVERGIELLREAMDLTKSPTLRRYALQSYIYGLAQLKRFDEAFASVAELREASVRHVAADEFEARLLLATGDAEGCLRVLERLPFVDVDDDGIERGRHTVASVRARALLELRRPGEAADVLLDALQAYGVLDEPLSVLVQSLAAAGRSPAEVAKAVRPESVPIIAAAASRLEPRAADPLLSALAERYPDRLEPLACAASAAPGFSVDRALHWSAALRRRGLADRCPLLVIGDDSTRPLLDRLHALGAAYGAFQDARAVEPARTLIASLTGPQRAEAASSLSAISPRLAELASAGETTALYLHLGPGRRDGYEDGRVGANGVDPVATGRAPNSLHALVVDDVLATLAGDDVGAALDEWCALLSDGGVLELRVPSARAAAARLAESADEEEALRALYGRRRFGLDGEEEAFSCGFTTSSLREALTAAGLAIEQLDERDGDLVARCRRAPVELRRSTGDDAIELSVLLVASEAEEAALRRTIASLATNEAGASFELVVLAGAPDAGSAQLLAALGGDVTTWQTPLPLDRARALPVGLGLARSPVVALIEPGITVQEGWASALVAAMADATVAMAAATVVSADGIVVHAGYHLAGDLGGRGEPRLELEPVHGHISATAEAVARGATPDALGPGCVALRRDALAPYGPLGRGLSAVDHLIDVSLAASEGGEGRLVVLGDCQVVDSRAAEPPDDKRRSRLAHRWSGRIELAPREVRGISRSSLLPKTTLVDRIERGHAAIVVPPRPVSGGCTLVGDLGGRRALPGLAAGFASAIADGGLQVVRLSYGAGQLAELDPGAFTFNTTLCLVEGSDLVDYLAAAGLPTLRDRRTIAFWNAPLPLPAQQAGPNTTMATEIWVPSAFSRHGLAGISQRVVRTVAPPVVPVAPTAATRAGLGLATTGPLLVSIAEVGGAQHGEVACANPQGIIEAFRAAFPTPGEAALVVRLVGRRDGTLEDELAALAGGRKDVTILSGDVAPADEEALLALADAYVTVQRSSAFCLPLARAVASATAVVAPLFGGPAEYLEKDPLLNVAFERRSSEASHLPFAVGSTWAEPDLDSAARALRSVVDTPPTPDELAARSRSLLATHGPLAASRALRKLLVGGDPGAGSGTPRREHRDPRKGRRRDDRGRPSNRRPVH